MLLTQLCLTLCDPTDCSPPDSSVHGILPDPGMEPVSPALQADLDSVPLHLPNTICLLRLS